MTADTYGHLFPRADDGSELAAAERAFLADESRRRSTASAASVSRLRRTWRWLRSTG